MGDFFSLIWDDFFRKLKVLLFVFVSLSQLVRLEKGVVDIRPMPYENVKQENTRSSAIRVQD